MKDSEVSVFWRKVSSEHMLDVFDHDKKFFRAFPFSDDVTAFEHTVLDKDAVNRSFANISMNDLRGCQFVIAIPWKIFDDPRLMHVDSDDFRSMFTDSNSFDLLFDKLLIDRFDLGHEFLFLFKDLSRSIHKLFENLFKFVSNVGFSTYQVSVTHNGFSIFAGIYPTDEKRIINLSDDVVNDSVKTFKHDFLEGLYGEKWSFVY
jgi:hypothetical protein